MHTAAFSNFLPDAKCPKWMPATANELRCEVAFTVQLVRGLTPKSMALKTEYAIL